MKHCSMPSQFIASHMFQVMDSKLKNGELPGELKVGRIKKDQSLSLTTATLLEL